jgi:hypothetical protein
MFTVAPKQPTARMTADCVTSPGTVVQDTARIGSSSTALNRTALGNWPATVPRHGLAKIGGLQHRAHGVDHGIRENLVVVLRLV